MFSGRWKIEANYKENQFFFDRDPSVFDCIMIYLRTGYFKCSSFMMNYIDEELLFYNISIPNYIKSPRYLNNYIDRILASFVEGIMSHEILDPKNSISIESDESDEKGHWVIFDFKKEALVSAYILDQSENYFENWVLQGSNDSSDDESWVNLSNIENNYDLNPGNEENTWKIKNSEYFLSYRFKLTGPLSNGLHKFNCNYILFYGDIKKE